MVNFKPADLSLNIKQVMPNTGLKSDKKAKECASFCLAYSSGRSQNVSERVNEFY